MGMGKRKIHHLYNMLPINEVIDAILVDYTRTSNITKSYTKQFGLACQAGDLHTIKNILDRVDDISYCLIIACYYGDLGVVNFIIKKYAPIEGIDFNKVLQLICRKGFTEMAKHLIDMCGKYDVEVNVGEVLYESCRGKNIDMLKYIADYANKQKINKLSIAAYNKALLLSCGYYRFDLYSLITDGIVNTFQIDINIVKYLIEECKANSINLSLQYASYVGSLDLITYLVEKITDDGYIRAAFKNACYTNTLDVIKYLATYKNLVDVHCMSSGLCRACSAYNGNCADVIEYLLHEYGDKDLTEALSCTSIYKLHIAMKLLIENGADPKINNTDVYLLLNMGIDVKLLEDKADKFVEIRNKRNKAIKEIMMDKTILCVDVIDVLCSYTEYTSY